MQNEQTNHFNPAVFFKTSVSMCVCIWLRLQSLFSGRTTLRRMMWIREGNMMSLCSFDKAVSGKQYVKIVTWDAEGLQVTPSAKFTLCFIPQGPVGRRSLGWLWKLQVGGSLQSSCGSGVISGKNSAIMGAVPTGHKLGFNQHQLGHLGKHVWCSKS